jgi:hypothetical protein
VVFPATTFVFVVGAALAVEVADLGDRDHVDGVVEDAVPASREPVHGPAALAQRDRCRPVVGGVLTDGREPAHVAVEGSTIAATTGATPYSSSASCPTRFPRR